MISQILKASPLSPSTVQSPQYKQNDYTVFLHTNKKIDAIIQGSMNELQYTVVFSTFLEKEKLFIAGVNNLIKTRNFLQLCIEHSEKAIDDDEFENEIKDHRKKYVIEMRSLKDMDELNLINEIIEKLDFKLDVSEVSDIFSVSSESILKAVKPYYTK